ncbi:MAG: hypothetical protein ACR2PG_25945 [Hyphomicrobiaceae bacterium]
MPARNEERRAGHGTGIGQNIQSANRPPQFLKRSISPMPLHWLVVLETDIQFDAASPVLRLRQNDLTKVAARKNWRIGRLRETWRGAEQNRDDDTYELNHF